jgi:hypothetical protein
VTEHSTDLEFAAAPRGLDASEAGRWGTLGGVPILPRDGARYLHDAGWKDLKLVVMLAVAGAESSLYSEATHVNEDGTTDWGWLQLNSGHPSLTRDVAFDPAQAAVYGYGLYRSASYSFRPWVAYTSGAYQRWIDTAIRGVANYQRGLYGLKPV